MFKKLGKDPFRLFFPLGWFMGMFSVCYWLAYGFNLLRFYPGLHHSSLMISGFLMSFIFGFLMTAIPRFTGTETAQPWELLLGLIVLITTILLAVWGQFGFFYPAVCGQLLFLMAYGGRRFARRKANPPSPFIFIGTGLATGLAGSLLLAFSSEGPLKILGQSLLYEGMVLSLILGVGSRLIPGIFGWSEILPAQKSAGEQSQSFLQSIPQILWFVLGLFLFSFVVQAFEMISVAYAFRALSISVVAIKYWRLPRRPKQRTIMNQVLWASCWLLVLGEWLPVIYPHLRTHMIHLTLIGGFGLTTLMIASRVTLAHGGHGLDLENKLTPYFWIGLLILVAAATRVLAPAFPESYLHHLSYSALMWILALLLWGSYFLRRIFKS